MTDKRPDPRLGNLPPGYEYQFRVRPSESEEEARARIFAQGDAGKRLLRDPDFNAAYQEILEENLQQIVTSKPGQDSLRDDAYFRIRGVQEIAYKLRTWVQIAEKFAEHLARQEGGEA